MSKVADNIRRQIQVLPYGTVRDIENADMRMFGFVLIDTVGALLEGIAITLEDEEE